VRVQEKKSSLGELVTGQQRPKRIFSDDDVELLAPHILSALSQATPEEHVVFQRIYPWEYGARTTAGTLYLHEDLLFLTITHYTRQPGGIKFSFVDDRQTPDPTGLRDQEVLFIPKEALRPDKSPQKPRHLHKATLAINYPLLETWRDTSDTEGTSHVRHQETTAPPDGPKRAVASSRQEFSNESPESLSEDTKLRSLEKDVNKQQLELDKLKREMRRLQGQLGAQEEPD